MREELGWSERVDLAAHDHQIQDHEKGRRRVHPGCWRLTTGSEPEHEGTAQGQRGAPPQGPHAGGEARRQRCRVPEHEGLESSHRAAPAGRRHGRDQGQNGHDHAQARGAPSPFVRPGAAPDLEAGGREKRPEERGRHHVLGGEAQQVDEGKPQEPPVERSVETEGGEDEQHEGECGQDSRSSTTREGQRHQHSRGEAEIEAGQKGLARIEERRPQGNAHRKVGDEVRKQEVEEGQRVDGPVRARGRRLAQPRAPAQELGGRQPLNGGQAQGHPPRPETGRPEAQHFLSRARCLCEVSAHPRQGRQRRDQAHVARAREHLAGRQPSELQDRREGASSKNAFEPPEHPGDPRRPREMVEQARRRQEGSGRAPGRAGEKGRRCGQPEATGQQEEAGSGHPAMSDHESLVVDRGGQQQVQPCRRIGELEVRVGEEGSAEADIGIPEWPRALGHRANEHLDVGIPIRVDVSLEEDAPGEDRVGEDGSGQQEEEE